MKILIIILGIVGGLGLLVWLGLSVKPGPLPAFAGENGEMRLVPLPEDLPDPVLRFYQEIYGDDIPLIHSAVISGKARLRVNGLPFLGRFRFTHQAGEGYRHYIEATIFGLPLMKVSETYLDGVSRMEMPFGVSEGEPKVNQGANLALWAEGMWYPAFFVTDPDAHWEIRDKTSAILLVPFEGNEERFIVHFDPDSGLLESMESMRYKGAESQQKTRWIVQALEWGTVDGYLIPKIGAVTWADEGSPWAVFTVENLVINYDVSGYIRAEGP